MPCCLLSADFVFVFCRQSLSKEEKAAYAPTLDDDDSKMEGDCDPEAKEESELAPALDDDNKTEDNYDPEAEAEDAEMEVEVEIPAEDPPLPEGEPPAKDIEVEIATQAIGDAIEDDDDI